MEEILKVEGLSKTFTLSRKQQKIERTSAKRKVAVDNLSFKAGLNSLSQYIHLISNTTAISPMSLLIW